MSRTPRLFIAGKIYEVCFRTEEGLPLVCTPYMEAILKGIIVSAFSRYELELVSFIVMGNHIHMHVRVFNPEHLDKLICYIKRESAHAINNLLDRKRHTVWLEGYDAVLILDADKMIERFGYVFLNVARANLESSIDLYPGLSSWRSIVSEDETLSGRRIPREVITALPFCQMSLDDQHQLVERLMDDALPEQQIRINPLAFLEVFPEAKNWDLKEVKERIVQAVRNQETRLAAKRDRPVLGAHALRLSSIHQKHESKKFGKKMWCFGSTREIRRAFIDWFKEQIAVRLELKKLLSPADYLLNLPPGFFAPGGYLRANLLPSVVPI